MVRHVLFAITFIGIGVLNSSAWAITDARCEDQLANCVGFCNNPGGGVTDNKCMLRCDRRATSCSVRAYYDAGRCTHTRAGWRCHN
jgi:hypothetical protein